MRDRVLATPAYQFTIPSLADGLILDCRIYHPEILNAENKNEGAPRQWKKKGAIVAHPYAPLGGCMDDPVVMTVVEQLLDLDIIVGTFNFRGAVGSKGSTTWTGKAELEDYISFAACLIHYLTSINIPTRADVSIDNPSLVHSSHLDDSISIIFGGYSYGSLIVSQLPETHELLQHLKDPSHDTAASEIILRAQTIATQTNESRDQHPPERGREQVKPSQGHRGSNSHHSITFGGEEQLHSSTGGNISREGRHSIDIPARIKNHIHRHSSKSIRRSSSQGVGRSESSLVVQAGIVVIPEIKSFYLLISPLLPPLSAFLAVSMSSLFARTPEPAVLLQHPTLVVYGSEDGFTSARRMRAWCKKMEARTSEWAFLAHEVEGVGHFWRERGAATELVGCIKEWTKSRLGLVDSQLITGSIRGSDQDTQL